MTNFSPEHVQAGFPLSSSPAKKPSPRRGARHAAPTALAAYAPDWMEQIARMRHRIEKERTPAGQDHLAIKTGGGGLMDAEFIAQALSLAHGWHEAGTLAALQRARQTGALAPPAADPLIASYRQLLRVECILRRWSFVGEIVLPDHPAPLYRVAVRCGYPSADQFMQDVAQWRRAIRAVYQKIFHS